MVEIILNILAWTILVFAGTYYGDNKNLPGVIVVLGFATLLFLSTK